MRRGWMIALGVLVALAVAGGSFFGGYLYGKNKGEDQANSFAVAGRGMRQFSQGGPEGLQGPGVTITDQSGTTRGGMPGTIETVGDGFFTVTSVSGEQTRVNVTDTTLMQKQTTETVDVTLADLQPGDTVMVSGNRADDGSITARSVWVGTTAFVMMGGQPGEIPPGTAMPAGPGTNP